MDETPIEIVEYDPAWEQRFADERGRIETWISDYTSRIDHVGGTSVPGLGSKPIIDITAVVSDLDGLWGDIDKLGTFLGYELSHVPGDHLFMQRVDADEQLYNLHLFQEGNEIWQADLQLREYLRANADAREEYEAVKREAANAHPNDIDAYNAAKQDVLESLVADAAADDSISIPDPE